MHMIWEQSTHNIEDRLRSWKTVTEEYGLNINIQKTMVIEYPEHKIKNGVTNYQAQNLKQQRSLYNQKQKSILR